MDDGQTPAEADELNPHIAHNARVWNYWLGGKDHYPADREVGDRVFGMFPNIVHVARADRAFLGRAVRHLAGEAGVSQFLDIGTGLPTVDNTHEVAQRVRPESRIVYVDNDPLVLLHARALLSGTPEGVTDYIDADARDPEAILRAAAKTLDFTRPVAVMLLGIMNFVLDVAEAQSVVRRLMAAVPSGSYLALTHPTVELGGEANIEAMRFWNEHARPPIVARTGEEIARFFDGLELLEPGLVSCSRWRPEAVGIGDAPEQVAQYGAVARKP
ncbi:O-methyltransferase involved in polyketide biosynthesis [Streptosporangium becharense]|uniref:O-methyltransferase involved in polyketide biosynthesis n=1 Tax=Streptosporangium becharense TaxID=1816182 RepID=A0A7W9MEP6_9ACTN|nr:SAM-dependent methyltransferase [Streptosporangium becharense]MBB2910864.1 O-methyltransferase involved in polyketide biosynthesis [Streptosporangium becharense]MBB5817559.1 O-methyltransferase involved in polyketide biosynthesis [Streptosporangium becharense]